MSEIVSSTINENFPVAGQDNDTQVFRDNFNSIKTALSVAKTEITDLQDNSARKDEQNDFNHNVIYKAVLQGSWERILNQSERNTETQFSFLEANYHIVKFTGDVNLVFQEFLNTVGPVANQGVGKITLELYGDGTKRKLSVSLSGSTVKKKRGFPALTLMGGHDLEVESPTNPIIIEVWQHNDNVIFLNYIGQFS